MEIVHCINLWKREDRLLSIAKQAKEQGFALLVWEGIETEKTPAQNINKAHKRIVQWAKDNKQKRVCICEDDCIFSSPNAFKYFISQIPESYDLFFTMLYSAQITDNRLMNGFSGLTCYMVHERFYDFFLSLPDHVHIDRWLGTFCHEKEYYVVEPYVAKQMGGFSDNLQRNMMYTVFEEKMVFYTE